MAQGFNAVDNKDMIFNETFSAELSSDGGSIGLRLTDLLRAEDQGFDFANKLETQALFELRSMNGSYSCSSRLEVEDDLLALMDALAEFSGLKSRSVSWSTSNGRIKLILKWNSSIDIQCYIKCEECLIRVQQDIPMDRHDVRDFFEVIFVVVLPQIDSFLAGIRRIIKVYQ